MMPLAAKKLNDDKHFLGMHSLTSKACFLRTKCAKGGAVNTTVLKRYERSLLKRRHEILPVLQHLSNEYRGASTDESDNNFSEAFLTERLAAVYERELSDIETALDRIRTGTFGYCFACRQAIEPTRLERFPRAEFCERCKAM